MQQENQAQPGSKERASIAQSSAPGSKERVSTTGRRSAADTPVRGSVVAKKFSAAEGADTAPADPAGATRNSVRNSKSEPSLGGPTDIPGTRPSRKTSKALLSKRRRPSSRGVLDEARGIAWEGLTLAPEDWGRLKEGLRGIPKVDHWMAGRSDKGETTLYISTRWAHNKKIVNPLKDLLPNRNLPEPVRDTEFLRKWLQTWVTVGESADLYTQRLMRPGRPPFQGSAYVAALTGQPKQIDSRPSSRLKPATSKMKGVSISGVPGDASYIGPDPS